MQKIVIVHSQFHIFREMFDCLNSNECFAGSGRQIDDCIFLDAYSEELILVSSGLEIIFHYTLTLMRDKNKICKQMISLEIAKKNYLDIHSVDSIVHNRARPRTHLF